MESGQFDKAHWQASGTLGAQAPLRRTWNRSTALGAVAGLAATVPMTVAMETLQRLLPVAERLPPPHEPLQITTELLRRFDLDRGLSPADRRRLAWCAHFGYGLGCGAGYAWLAGGRPRHRMSQSALYGLLIWTASYAGWLPAAGILPPPTRRPPGRNLVLIAAHLVWGWSAAGVLVAVDRPHAGRLEERTRR